MQTSEVEFVTGLWPKQRIIISYVLGHEQSVLTATQQKLSVDDFKWRKDMFGFVTMDVSLKLMLSIWQKYRLMCRAGLMEYIKKKNIEWLTLMLQKKKKNTDKSIFNTGNKFLIIHAEQNTNTWRLCVSKNKRLT